MSIALKSKTIVFDFQSILLAYFFNVKIVFCVNSQHSKELNSIVLHILKNLT